MTSPCPGDCLPGYRVSGKRKGRQTAACEWLPRGGGVFPGLILLIRQKHNVKRGKNE
ncbi:hypothetical protein SEETMRM10961_10475 [Salmonella enterica subsp. enterica serovar Typhimurium]|nr:hypothetical protein SEETMRM10961_10475 [Salmonella enterica subsp. enterica serovar Typhimurium]